MGEEMNERKNYVVTTAQMGAKPNQNFLVNAEKYCDDTESELIILPTNGRKTTSRRNADKDEEERLDEYLQQFKVISKNYSLNSNLAIKHFPVKAQQIDPITGWGRFVHADKSGIFASPKQRLKCFANDTGKLPKILMSTGAITVPRYKDNNWGTKAKLDHVVGAITVKVIDDKIFHFRQLRANYKGIFQDLGRRYENGKSSFQRIEALIPGDIHSTEVDREVHQATLDMIRELKPKYLVLHDLFNGNCMSYFDRNKSITKALNHSLGLNVLGTELEACGELLHDYLKAGQSDMQIKVVKSNHDERLDRYLEEGLYLCDHPNFDLAVKLVNDKLKGVNVLQSGIEKMYKKMKRVEFLSRQSSLRVKGYQIAKHGDVGSGGSRGNIRQDENTYGKVITGHTHSPEILRNAFKMGCSIDLLEGYQTRGADAWLNTHGIIYGHGQPCLVNIIEGEWKK